MSIKELFKDFPNSAKNYYEWCVDNEELKVFLFTQERGVKVEKKHYIVHLEMEF